MCNQSSTLIHSHLISQTGGLAQLARAPALQAGGQRFESVILHYSLPYIILGLRKRSLTY